MSETSTRTCVYGGDVRAQSDPSRASGSGKVEISRRGDNGAWKPVAELRSNVSNDAFFGTSIGITRDGKFLVVASTVVNRHSAMKGIVSIFENAKANAWVQVGGISIDLSPYKQSTTAFDDALFLSDDRRLISIGGDTGDRIRTPLIYEYSYTQRSWVRRSGEAPAEPLRRKLTSWHILLGCVLVVPLLYYV